MLYDSIQQSILATFFDHVLIYLSEISNKAKCKIAGMGGLKM